jgi:hypothetical protein
MKNEKIKIIEYLFKYQYNLDTFNAETNKFIDEIDHCDSDKILIRNHLIKFHASVERFIQIPDFDYDVFMRASFHKEEDIIIGIDFDYLIEIQKYDNKPVYVIFWHDRFSYELVLKLENKIFDYFLDYVRPIEFETKIDGKCDLKYTVKRIFNHCYNNMSIFDDDYLLDKNIFVKSDNDFDLKVMKHLNNFKSVFYKVIYKFESIYSYLLSIFESLDTGTKYNSFVFKETLSDIITKEDEIHIVLRFYIDRDYNNDVDKYFECCLNVLKHDYPSEKYEITIDWYLFTKNKIPKPYLI